MHWMGLKRQAGGEHGEEDVRLRWPDRTLGARGLGICSREL